MAERPASPRPKSPTEKGIRSMEEGELSVILCTIIINEWFLEYVNRSIHCIYQYFSLMVINTYVTIMTFMASSVLEKYHHFGFSLWRQLQ